MSYRGRGSSYRGSGSRRGGWSGESRGRSSRNGEHFYKEPSSNYRPYHGEREKFSSYRGDSHYSRGRQQHDSYPPRRERSHQRGPSPERKRMRADTYTSVGSSHSRDHDSYGGRGMYSESSSNDRVVFREERRSVRGDRRSSDYQSYRKSGPPSHSVEPSPRFTSPRGGRGSRGSSFRGRGSSFRGTTRAAFVKPLRTKPSFGAVKKSRVEYSSRGRSLALIRKRKEQEILQKYKRLKMQQMKWRRAILAKRSSSRKADGSEEEGKKETKAEEEDGEIEEEVEEEIEEEVEEEVEEEPAKTGEEATDEAKDDSEKPKPKVKKVVKKIVKKVIKKPAKSSTSNGPIKTDGTAEKTEKEASPEQKTAKEDSPVRKTFLGKPFIRLECPQCEDRYVTFREYEDHLRTSKHKAAMRSKSMQLKEKLARLRLQQREEQREIDEKLAAEGAKFKTMFCETCKLMYKQKRMDHNDSEKHKKTKILLNPWCRPCRMRFLSPMQYEAHIASLEHIQQKARSEAYEERLKMKKAKEEVEGKAVNMDNFMVLDSVGSGDESVEESQEKSDSKETPSENKEAKKRKSAINLGSEYCKKIEVYYCELCRMQVPRSTTLENALALHCRNRLHLKKFIRARDDKALRRKAERIHREKEEREKKEKKVAEATKEKVDGDTSVTTNSDEKVIKQEEECDSEAEGKFWKEIESDLPDISDDIGENKSSDDEDDCNSRYDRFNTNNDDKPIKAEACEVDEKDAVEEATAEEGAKEENELEETKTEN